MELLCGKSVTRDLTMGAWRENFSALENESNFLCRCFDRRMKYSMAILVTDGTKMKGLCNAFDSFVIVVDLMTMILINLKGF
jgi:hypothetical protein